MRIKLDTPLTFSEIAHCTACRPPRENRIAEYISTDTRELSFGDVFISLRGKNYDGESFLGEAKKMGAFTVSTVKELADFHVSDTEDSLLKLSKYYKETALPNLKLTVAITGSVGKTTTKEIVCALLKEKYMVHATKENFNNSIGTAHTLLSAPKSTEILVCELGMNHFGEIKRLADAVKPDIAIITNIGTAHIENLGSRENIAKAKLEITECKNSTVLIAPIDEPLLKSRRDIGFALNSPADSSIYLSTNGIRGALIDIQTSRRMLKSVKTGLYGEHNILSLSSAVAVLDLLDFSDEDIIRAVFKLNNSMLRPKIINVGGILIYDDTYSASPEATLTMLKHVSRLGYAKKSCVLGDMLELGKNSENAHRLIGRTAAELGYEKIYCFGNYATLISEGAKSYTRTDAKIYINEDLTSPKTTAQQITSSYDGGIILVKASHSVHAERIYKYLKNTEPEEKKEE